MTDTIQRAIDVLDDVLSWGDTPSHILKSASEALTSLREMRSVDVEGVKRNVVFMWTEEFKDNFNKPSPRQTIDFTIDHLAGNGYLRVLEKTDE